MSAVPTVPEMLERLTAMRLELLEMLDSPQDGSVQRERIAEVFASVRDTEKWARDLERGRNDA